MKIFARIGEYERANYIKRQIFALGHIQDVALLKSNDTEFASLKSEDSFRIEAYDAAHLSGTNNVGVMIVMENGEFKKSDYRKFKIQNSKGNDIGALKEIMERRLNHSEWPLPNLIVLDGGIAQLNASKEIINKKRQGFTLMGLVAVTKDEKHKPKALIGDESIIKKYKKEILLANNEAHRLAVAFHRQRRSAII
jgi:excinuclease ABC subunit C